MPEMKEDRSHPARVVSGCAYILDSIWRRSEFDLHRVGTVSLDSPTRGAASRWMCMAFVLYIAVSLFGSSARRSTPCARSRTSARGPPARLGGLHAHRRRRAVVPGHAQLHHVALTLNGKNSPMPPRLRPEKADCAQADKLVGLRHLQDAVAARFVGTFAETSPAMS